MKRTLQRLLKRSGFQRETIEKKRLQNISTNYLDPKNSRRVQRLLTIVNKHKHVLTSKEYGRFKNWIGKICGV